MSDETHEWSDLPERALETMEWLGRFGPTTNTPARELKGTMCDEDGDIVSAYIDAETLRSMAVDFCTVADWLDARAKALEDVK